MMSKKNFLIVLLVFCFYLLIGAMIFHGIELAEEQKRILQEIKERIHVIEVVKKYGTPDKKELFDALEGYCGKSIRNVSTLIEPKWDFYHSLFFVVTVVSTIGYGNLAPTTMFGRIFMIFYGLVGIPINGFVMLTLGDFFGKSFTKLYNRWKDTKKLRQIDPSALGLVAQIILYLVPGFTFFIFVPSIVISAFEGWDYDVAVYYAFVTLTTIGFGDYVAGVNGENFSVFHKIFYQIFLLVWVIGGLGYVVMILNFIAKGMRSKKLQQFEHRIASNIMKTPTKIRQELRSILEEFLMVRVKKVYKEFDYKPQHLERSQSCPDLTIYRPTALPNFDRKRAFSECQDNFILQRIQSDTDLERIDKELTFKNTNEQADLIIKVVDALSINEFACEPGCYEGFSEKEILASEQYDSAWSLASQNVVPPHMPFRSRAASDARYNPRQRLQKENEHTWYGQTYLAKYAKLIKDEKSTSEPNTDIQKDQPGFFRRIKNTLLSKQDKSSDLEKGTTVQPDDSKIKKQPISQPHQHGQILENTSVADLIRALTALSDPSTPSTSQDNKNQKRTRRMPIRSNFQNRRTSLMPINTPILPVQVKPVRRSSLIPTSDLAKFSVSSGSYNFLSNTRRSSLSPVSELPSPNKEERQQNPSYPLSPSKIRRFSIRPVTNVSTPPQKYSKKDSEDIS